MASEIVFDGLEGEKIRIELPDAFVEHIGPVALETLRAFVVKLYASETPDQWVDDSRGWNRGG